MNKDEIREQAVRLAKENTQGEPEIREVWWFPHEEEVRLIELEDDLIPTPSGHVEPFYFGPCPEEGLPSHSGVALIRTDEFSKLELPDDWGAWEHAEKLEIDS